MTFDGFSTSYNRHAAQPGGFIGHLPRQSTLVSRVNELDRAAGYDLASGLAVGTASAASRNFSEMHPILYKWGWSSGMWGARDFLADGVNRAFYTPARELVSEKSSRALTSSKQSLPTPVSGAGAASAGLAKGQLDEMNALFEANGKQNLAKVQAPTAPVPVPVQNYSYLLNLGDKEIQLKDFNWKAFKEKVKGNTALYNKTGIKQVGQDIGKIFTREGFKGYLRNTVWETNVKPIRELFSNSQEKAIGSGIFRVAAFSVIGWDILKHTRDAYRHAKSKEDGTLSGRLRTWSNTGLAFMKYAMRGLVSWEVAGIGLAIGRAILPIALGPISLGGILVGGLFGALAQKGLDKILKTGSQDPAAQALKKETPKQNQAGKTNPFASAS